MVVVLQLVGLAGGRGNLMVLWDGGADLRYPYVHLSHLNGTVLQRFEEQRVRM